MEPAFNISLIKNYIKTTNELGKRLIKHLKSQGNSSVQDVFPMFSKLTFQIICGNYKYIDLYGNWTKLHNIHYFFPNSLLNNTSYFIIYFANTFPEAMLGYSTTRKEEEIEKLRDAFENISEYILYT